MMRAACTAEDYLKDFPVKDIDLLFYELLIVIFAVEWQCRQRDNNSAAVAAAAAPPPT